MRYLNKKNAHIVFFWVFQDIYEDITYVKIRGEPRGEV